MSSAEELAAIIGLLAIHNGGDIRVPMDVLRNGLPEGSGIRVEFDQENDEMVVGIREVEDGATA